MRSIELIEFLNDVLSGILIPYIYTIRMLLARKIFHEENFLQGKFFPVTLMYSFRIYSIDYVAVIPTKRNVLVVLKEDLAAACFPPSIATNCCSPISLLALCPNSTQNSQNETYKSPKYSFKPISTNHEPSLLFLMAPCVICGESTRWG